MNIYLPIVIITSITSVILGAFVYLRNPKSLMGRFFILFCVSTATWLVTDYLVHHSDTYEVSLVAVHIAPAAAYSAFFCLYQFAANFGDRPWKGSKIYLYAFLIGGIAFAASPLTIKSISPGINVKNLEAGPGYVIFLASLVIPMVGAIWQLILKGRSSSTIVERRQVSYILWGIGATFSLAIINNGIIPFIIPNWQLLQLTPLMVPLFIGSISYAIVKHRLFDIRFVVARTVAYTLLVGMLLAIYTVAVFAVTSIIFRNHVAEIQAIIFAGLAIFVAATFQPLKNTLEKLTDRIFFRQHYDTDEVLHELTKIMATTLGTHGLANKTLDLLTSQVHIARGAFFVQTEKGLQMPANRSMAISKDQTLELLKLVNTKSQLLIFDEIADGQIKNLMRQLDINVAAALVASGKIHGLLVLGEKQSGQIYTDQDINLLQILTPELAVAVNNSLNFEQISQFNQLLESEVEQATKDLRAANKQLERKNHQLQQLDRLKDEFISVTSHELRTPLTAIRGYLWMAMHGKNKDRKYQNYMERAYASTEWLISIVNDTLDIARMESGRMELQPQPTDVTQLAEIVVNELASKSAERHQSLVVQKPNNLALVHCDQAKIHQVLVNLIGNAQKFTPEGGRITISFVQQKEDVEITVADTGVGISPDDQQKLFQKFSRLESSATTPGTGLGLYLCKQIIDLSRGNIWVDSQAGKGSKFHFTLPIDGSPKSELPVKQPIPKSNIDTETLNNVSTLR